MDLRYVECVKQTLNNSVARPFSLKRMVHPSAVAESDSEAAETLVQRIVDETGLADKFSGDKAPFIEYLARAAVHAFDNHSEIEDDAFFSMVRSAVACKPNNVSKWKDQIRDWNGVRRNVVIRNKTLVIKQDHGTFMPIVPLTVSAMLERKDKERDYEHNRPWSTEGMERVLTFRSLPDPERKIRHKGDPLRVRLRR